VENGRRRLSRRRSQEPTRINDVSLLHRLVNACSMYKSRRIAGDFLIAPHATFRAEYFFFFLGPRIYLIKV